MHLDYNNIFDYTQDTMEYLFLDSAEIEPGISGIAIKNLSMQDWFFKMHFPGNPIMPGVLIMEAIMEVGTLVLSTLPGKAKATILFNSCDEVKIMGEVRPGDIMHLKADLTKYKRGIAVFNGSAMIQDKIIARMKFTLIVRDEIVLRNQ